MPTGPPDYVFIGGVYGGSGPVFVSAAQRASATGLPPRTRPPWEDNVPRAGAADGRARDGGRGRDPTHVEPPVPEAEGHLGASKRRFHVVPVDGSDTLRILRIEVQADLERERGRAQGRIQPVVAVPRVHVGRPSLLQNLVPVRIRHFDGEVAEPIIVGGRQSRVRPGIEDPLSGAVV